MVDSELACAGCKKKDVVLYACGRCEMEHYCGELCQRACWRTHKKICKTIDADLVHGAKAGAEESVFFGKIDKPQKLNSPCTDPEPQKRQEKQTQQQNRTFKDWVQEHKTACQRSNIENKSKRCGRLELPTGMDVSAYFRLPTGRRSLTRMDGCVEEQLDHLVTVRFKPGVTQNIPVDWIGTASSGAEEGGHNSGKASQEFEDEQDQHEQVHVENTSGRWQMNGKGFQKQRHASLSFGRRMQSRERNQRRGEVHEHRRQHAEKVCQEREAKRKAEKERQWKFKEEHGKWQQQEQRKMREEQAERRLAEEVREIEIAKRKTQREEERVGLQKRQAEQQLAADQETLQACECDSQSREDAHGAVDNQCLTEAEERERLAIQRREVARQMTLERRASKTRRRERLAARKQGVSWRAEVEESAKAREGSGSFNKNDFSAQVKAEIATRKRIIDEEIAVRKKLIEEAAAKSSQNGSANGQTQSASNENEDPADVMDADAALPEQVEREPSDSGVEQEEQANEEANRLETATVRLGQLIEQERARREARAEVDGDDDAKASGEQGSSSMSAKVILMNLIRERMASNESDHATTLNAKKTLQQKMQGHRCGAEVPYNGADEGDSSEAEEYPEAQEPAINRVTSNAVSIWRPAVPSDSENDEDDSGHEGAFDSLLSRLKSQIRTESSKKPTNPGELQEAIMPGPILGTLERSCLAQRTLELIEARRLAEGTRENGRGRKKNKNSVNKRCEKDAISRKMDEEFAAEERGMRYVNNMAIYSKKQENTVDAL